MNLYPFQQSPQLQQVVVPVPGRTGLADQGQTVMAHGAQFAAQGILVVAGKMTHTVFDKDGQFQHPFKDG